jgi:hypothetical protein
LFKKNALPQDMLSIFSYKSCFEILERRSHIASQYTTSINIAAYQSFSISMPAPYWELQNIKLNQLGNHLNPVVLYVALILESVYIQHAVWYLQHVMFIHLIVYYFICMYMLRMAICLHVYTSITRLTT